MIYGPNAREIHVSSSKSAPSAVAAAVQVRPKHSALAAFYQSNKIYNQHVVDTALLMSMEIDDDLQSHMDDAKSFRSLRSLRSIRSEVHIISSKDGGEDVTPRQRTIVQMRRSSGVINVPSSSNPHSQKNSQHQKR